MASLGTTHHLSHLALPRMLFGTIFAIAKFGHLVDWIVTRFSAD
jgi:hypothetical protein